MDSVPDGLKKLHLLLLESHETLQKLERGPKLIEGRQKKTAAKAQEISKQKEALIQFRKAADQRNLQLKTNEARITELKGKLNAAASNREYDIIRSQIDADEMANSVLEDEILESLEKVDSAQSRVAELEVAYEAALKDEKTIAATIEAEKPQLEVDAARHLDVIKEAEKVIPGKLGETYKRLVKQHGAGALAPLEQNACGACFATLSRQELVRMNVGDTMICRQCNRIMYKSE
ncbi:MAG: hypothetical protein O3A00_07505 [Planctomycetota bacterium]|nr:hypothetical protein [Planctomycetota bacterium]